jgi:hypothetical protein
MIKRGLASVVLLSVACMTARAQVTEAQRTSLERVALGKARTQLHAAICRLPLKGELTVGAWAARSSGLDRALRGMARSQPRQSAARVYSDGACDLDLRLAPDELARQLIALREKEPNSSQSGDVTAADISAAARTWPTLSVSGSAEVPERDATAKLDGWEDVSAEGEQLAKLAAQADAVFALLEEAAKLKVTPARRVQEFLDSGEEVRTAAAAAIQAAAEIRVDLAPDQVCVADARISIPALISALTDVHQKCYKGEMFKAADFREMALTAGLNEIRATGLAPPPEKLRLKPEYELIELDRPAWAEKSAVATGRYVPADGDDFPPAMRTELARWDGMDQLRRQVEALPIQHDITIERLLGYRPALKDDVVIFLSGARIIDKPKTEASGGVEVRVEVGLERLWRIIRRAGKRIELDPSEATTRPSTAATEVER